ncbi:unnamed protein product [Mytilus edulis]|uniref:MEGF10_11 n=1 Tax=Mytilus edulis TaxID=6550 RepID=A0A8S3PRQ0_MYTED|nr:unnamed protein product [Mytilus edulis]
MVKGICTVCKNGTTSDPGSRCESCKNDTYGHKCIEKCKCNHFHRCDPEVGCILKTSTPKIVTIYAGTTQPSSLSSHRVTTKETIVTGNGNVNDTRSSKADWMIYILCITSCFFLTGFCHWFRTYRKRQSLEVRIINENVASEPFTLCMGENDEDDKKPLTFVKTESLHTHKTSNNETINFVFNDEESNIASNDHDEAGYFDMYFTIEDINHQAENQVSQKDPNACQVPVTVHQCIERSSLSREDDTSNIYSNVFMPMQKDRKMIKQANDNEKHLSSDSKTVHDITLPLFIRSTFRNFYSQNETNKAAASEKTIVACDTIDSYEEKSMEKSKTF